MLTPQLQKELEWILRKFKGKDDADDSTKSIQETAREMYEKCINWWKEQELQKAA